MEILLRDVTEISQLSNIRDVCVRACVCIYYSPMMKSSSY